MTLFPRKMNDYDVIAGCLTKYSDCQFIFGMHYTASLSFPNRIVHSHAWPNYSRYRKGLPSVLPSSMDNLWSGEYVAQEEGAPWPELFLYSKSDFYLPYEHLEQEVLARRKALGRDFRTVR